MALLRPLINSSFMQQNDNELLVVVNDFFVRGTSYVNVKKCLVVHMFFGVLEQVAYSELVVVLVGLLPPITRIKINKANIILVIFLTNNEQIICLRYIGLTNLVWFIGQLDPV
jgi:hypothetical protein